MEESIVLYIIGCVRTYLYKQAYQAVSMVPTNIRFVDTDHQADYIGGEIIWEPGKDDAVESPTTDAYLMAQYAYIIITIVRFLNFHDGISK